MISKFSIAASPNFIIWVADDQYLSSVGSYGAATNHTPNIDKFAEEGIRFTKGYSTVSVCTPARSALYTGMYPIKNGSHPNHSGLKKDIPSMPSIMKGLGYRTGIVGKHGVHDVPTRPTNTFDWDVLMPKTKVPIDPTSSDPKVLSKHGSLDWQAIENFMQPKSKPYVMFVASSLPHGPYLSKLENGLEGYDANNWTTDWQFGKTMDILDQSGERSNTVVIFVSDNGSNTELSKYTLFEPGVHIPFIIRWPGNVAAGTTSDELVDFTDIMPTLMELAGGQANSDMDGISLVPLMEGKNVDLREDIFLSFTALGVNGIEFPYPLRGVVTDQFKLIKTPQYHKIPPKGDYGTRDVINDPPPAWMLFDLNSDPEEKNNLATNKDYEDVLKDMQTRLEAWQLKVGDVNAKGEIDEIATEIQAIDMFCTDQADKDSCDAIVTGITQPPMSVKSIRTELKPGIINNGILTWKRTALIKIWTLDGRLLFSETGKKGKRVNLEKHLVNIPNLHVVRIIPLE